MARIEADKEDLIADATALVQRAEYVPGPEASCPWNAVTTGYRKDGSLSLYFDQDPFFQFDNTGGLRRAYFSGLLYRSHGRTLAQLKRHRSDDQTALQRTDLSADQLEQFRLRMMDELKRLQTAFKSGQLHKSRSVPEDLCLQDRTLMFLECVQARGTDFLSDSIRTQK